MDTLQLILNWLLPATDDVLLRGRAGLVIVTCFGVAIALVSLTIVWAITRDLQKQTVVASTVLLVLLTGIGVLARRGSVPLATWLLILLLVVIIAAEVYMYGVASLPASALVLPILVAAYGVGLVAAFGIAALGSTYIWLLAWGEQAGWYTPQLGCDISHLTFNAPGLTVLFLVVALTTGAWSDYVAGFLH